MAVQAALAVGGALLSAGFGRSGRSAQKRAVRAQMRVDQLQRFNSRVQAARQTAVARAEAVAMAGNEGLLGASSVQGALGAQLSQYGGSVAYANQIEREGRIISAAQQKAQKRFDQANMIGSLTGAASSAFGAFQASGAGPKVADYLSSAGSNLFEAGQEAVGSAVSFFAPRTSSSSFYRTQSNI